MLLKGIKLFQSVNRKLIKNPRFFAGGPSIDAEALEETRELDTKVKTKTMYYVDPESVS